MDGSGIWVTPANSVYGGDENGDKKQSHVSKTLYTELRSLNFILPGSEHVRRWPVFKTVTSAVWPLPPRFSHYM